MSFNYGLERKKFEREWTKLRIEYAEAGMSDDAIQQMYEYDLSVFNRKRADAKHEQPFDGLQDSNKDEVLEDRNPLMEKYFKSLIVEDSYFVSSDRFSWIETIQNEDLYNKLSSLSNNDKELLTLIVIDELGIREIARMQNKAASTISEKFNRIKKILM